MASVWVRLCGVALVVLLLVVEGDAAYEKKYYGNIRVKTLHNVTLVADAFIPQTSNRSHTFPILIFPNSWMMPQIEYIAKTMDFAAEGYIAFEYETRGWYSSGGHIDCAGPLDRADASTVIDYVLAQKAWQPDPNNIGFVGISYGGGISLMMAHHDKRVKTAMVLSGWSNLTDALYGYDTANQAWGSLLVDSAKIVGRPSPELLTSWADLEQHKNISYVQDFSWERSPHKYLASYNRRNVPLFFSSNFLDRLFRPNVILKFFHELTVPKYILLNKGVHAEAAGFGLVGLKSYVWTKVKLWADHWLRGMHTGIMEEDYVHAETGDSVLSGYESFKKWPVETNLHTYFFTPRGTNQYGGLSITQGNSSWQESIQFTSLPSLTQGNVLTDIATSLGDAYTNTLTVADRKTSLVYLSDPLKHRIRICGTPRLNITAVGNQAAWQIYAFLYSVDDLGTGTLLSDTFYTVWENGTKPVNVRGVDLHTFCRSVEAGQRLGVGLVLYNTNYKPANPSPDLAVDVVYAGRPSIQFPVVEEW